MNRVQEEIHCSTTACQEWTPPPVMILQMNRSLRLSRSEFYWSKKEDFVSHATLTDKKFLHSCRFGISRCEHLNSFFLCDARQDVLTLKFAALIFDFSIFFNLATAEWQQNFASTIFCQLETLFPRVKFSTYFFGFDSPQNFIEISTELLNHFMIQREKCDGIRLHCGCTISSMKMEFRFRFTLVPVPEAYSKSSNKWCMHILRYFKFASKLQTRNGLAKHIIPHYF